MLNDLAYEGSAVAGARIKAVTVALQFLLFQFEYE